MADGPGVAGRTALLVAGFRRPDGGELDLACPARTVGLLPGPALCLLLAHRDPGAVQPQVEGGGPGRLGLDDLAFVLGDLASQGLGMTLDLLRPDREAGQFPQQDAALLEAQLGRRDADHAKGARRQGPALDAERTVARAEPAATGLAVIPCPLQGQRPEGRHEGLAPPPRTARVSAAGTGQLRLLPVRKVGVQPGGKQGGSGAQRCLPDHPLQDLEVDPVRRAGDQPVDVGRDLRPDRRREAPPFSGPEARLSFRLASARDSLAATKADTTPRKRWYSSSRGRVSSTSSRRRRVEETLPSIDRVRMVPG